MTSHLRRIGLPLQSGSASTQQEWEGSVNRQHRTAEIDQHDDCRTAGHPIDKVLLVPTRIEPDDFWRQVGASPLAPPKPSPSGSPRQTGLREVPLPLGVAVATGRVVDLPAHRSPHFVIVGASGSGRSSTLRALSEAIRGCYAPDDCDDRCAASVVVIDERGDLEDVKRQLAEQHYLLPSGPGPKDALGAVAALVAQRTTPGEAPAVAAVRRTQTSPQVFVLIDAPGLLGQEEWRADIKEIVERGYHAGVHVYFTADANDFALKRLTSPLWRALASAPTLLLRGPRSADAIWPGSGIRFVDSRPPGRGLLVVDPSDTLATKTIQLPYYSDDSSN